MHLLFSLLTNGFCLAIILTIIIFLRLATCCMTVYSVLLKLVSLRAVQLKKNQWRNLASQNKPGVPPALIWLFWLDKHTPYHRLCFHKVICNTNRHFCSGEHVQRAYLLKLAQKFVFLILVTNKNMIVAHVHYWNCFPKTGWSCINRNTDLWVLRTKCSYWNSTIWRELCQFECCDFTTILKINK